MLNPQRIKKLESISFNPTDFNHGVVILGNIKADDETGTHDIFELWKQQIQSPLFSDSYMVDTAFTESFADLSGFFVPNGYTKLVDSISAKKQEDREKRRQIVFIEDITKVNQSMLPVFMSESRGLNASLIVNIPEPLNTSHELLISLCSNAQTFFIGDVDESTQALITKLTNIKKDHMESLHHAKFGFVFHAFYSNPHTEKTELHLL